MGDHYRKLMDEAVKKSFVDGHLDLSKLRYNTNAVMEKVEKEPQYVDEYEMRRTNKDLKPLNDKILAKLAVATREVLGIIPEGQWNADSDGINLIKEALSPAYERDKTIVVIRNGKPFDPLHPGDYDPTKSLESQHFEIVTQDYLIQHREKHTGHNKQTHEEHPSHLSEKELKGKLSHDVTELGKKLAGVTGDDLNTQDKNAVTKLLDEVVSLDKELRKLQPAGSAVYSPADRETLVKVVNDLHAHHIGVSDHDVGGDISYLITHGIHPPKKDQARGPK